MAPLLALVEGSVALRAMLANVAMASYRLLRYGASIYTKGEGLLCKPITTCLSSEFLHDQEGAVIPTFQKCAAQCRRSLATIGSAWRVFAGLGSNQKANSTL